MTMTSIEWVRSLPDVGVEDISLVGGQAAVDDLVPAPRRASGEDDA